MGLMLMGAAIFICGVFAGGILLLLISAGRLPKEDDD